MYWLEVSVVTDGEGAEAVAEALRPYAHQGGVVFEQLGDEADPAPDALLADVTVKIYIAEGDDSPGLRRKIEEILYFLGRLYPLPAPTFRLLQDEDWANAWKEHYRPFKVGERLWIWPSWLDPGSDDVASHRLEDSDLILRLDPGMAFGTGSHPTTQMCLQALESLVRPGMSLLDVGTGSAILAIAAAKLGASTILGIDIDDLAVQAAASNVSNNGVNQQVTIAHGTLETIEARTWDIVVVNILAPVIVDMLANQGLLDYVTPHGYVILSGIITEQADEIEATVSRYGGETSSTRQMGDWISFVVKRTSA